MSWGLIWRPRCLGRPPASASPRASSAPARNTISASAPCRRGATSRSWRPASLRLSRSRRARAGAKPRDLGGSPAHHQTQLRGNAGVSRTLVRPWLAARRGAAAPSQELIDELRTGVTRAEQVADPLVQIVERAAQPLHGLPPHHSKVTIERNASATLLVPPCPFE